MELQTSDFALEVLFASPHCIAHLNHYEILKVLVNKMSELDQVLYKVFVQNFNLRVVSG